MKKSIKKIMGVALAFCMTAVMLCGGLAEVQAASYAKSFTKTANITGGLLQLTMNAKKNTTITVSVSTTSKDKNLYLQAKMYKKDGDMAISYLDSENKSGKFKVNIKKGVNTLYIENLTGKSVKVKIKVTAKSGKVIKYKGMELIEEAG